MEYLNKHKRLFTLLFLMWIRGFTLIIKFLFTLYITKFLGVQAVGVYGLILISGFMFTAFTDLGLTSVICRDAVLNSNGNLCFNIKKYLRYHFWVTIIFFITSVVVSVYIENSILILLSSVIIITEHYSNFFYNILLNTSKHLSANILHFVRTALWMIMFMGAASIYSGFYSMEWVLIFYIVGCVLSLLSVFLIVRQWQWRRFNKKTTLKSWLKEKFIRSRFFYKQCVINTFSQNISSYLISFFLGIDVLGVYMYFNQACSAMQNLISTGILQVYKPKLVQAFKNSQDMYNTYYVKCFNMSLLTAVAMAITIYFVLHYVTVHYIERPEVIENYSIFGIMLIAFLLGSVRNVIMVKHYSRFEDAIMLNLTYIIIWFDIFLVALLLYFYGIYGAASALVINNIIWLILERNKIQK